MAQKRKFMVFKVLVLFEVHIQQDSWHRGTHPGVLLKEKNFTFQNNKEIHNGCEKMQQYIVAGCIKGFLIIC